MHLHLLPVLNIFLVVVVELLDDLLFTRLDYWYNFQAVCEELLVVFRRVSVQDGIMINCLLPSCHEGFLDNGKLSLVFIILVCDRFNLRLVEVWMLTRLGGILRRTECC